MINLVPIDRIAKAAKTDKIHLAYLTKLRLLPQTIRRKVGSKITGCYPEWVIPLIKRIEDLKDRGLTYSQIKFQLDNNEIVKWGGTRNGKLETEMGNGTWESQNSPFSLPNPDSHFALPTSNSYSLAFLVIGLLLGYLLAAKNINSPMSPTTSDKSLATSSVVSPLDDSSKTMLQVVTTNKTSAQDPIYLIAVPRQNFYRLGQVNLADLNGTYSR